MTAADHAPRRDVQALYAQACRDRDGGEPEAALAGFEAVLSADASHTGAMGNLGNLFRQQGDLSQARHYYEMLLRHDPDSTATHVNLAGLLAKLGEYNAATEHYEAAIRLGQEKELLYQPLGILYCQTDRWDDAILLFQQAVRAMPDDAKRHYWLGRSYTESKQPEKAIPVLEQCLALDPSHVEASIYLGHSYSHMEKGDEALPHLIRATEIAPEHPAAWHALGHAWYKQGRMEEARKAYAQAHRLSPQNATIVMDLGITEQNMGLIPDSRQHLELATSLQPQMGYAWRTLILTYLYDQDFDRLRVAAQEAFTAAPLMKPAHYDNILCDNAIAAWLQQDIGACRDAITHCRQRMYNYPNYENQKTLGGYTFYLDALLNFRESHPALYQDQSGVAENKDMPPLYVIGDSHCLSFSGLTLSLGGEKRYRAEPRLIMGCKAWHLAREQPDPQKYAFERIISQIPDGAAIMLTPGEIDCRPDEGIHGYCRKRGLPLHEHAIRTATGYVEHVMKYLAPKHARVLFWGVPAHGIALPDMPAEEGKRYLEMVRDYSAALAEQARAHGAEFVDVFALTAGADLFSNGKYHLPDKCHLQPSAIQTALDSAVRTA